jgi:Tetrapyrrole (Corrin/Porphyrin) Methylases
MEPAQTPGELVILGSGIGAMGFTRDAEQYIDDADHVLYCVADPVTQVWLRERRPDSIDLFALYDDRKRRYDTYMQMTEAMLFFVRQGKKVVAIFYGHPGIFVLSTHRAVSIARREGHRAQLRPGVSALDWLCADLGVDPAFPGLQTFEATDMLLRRRAIDVCSHVVLWQVGLIAEMGFRRRGFHNRNFGQLVDYLLGYYDSGHQVTHYIASKFPSLPSTIEEFRIDELMRPDVLQRFTGISTFYIPPAEGRAIDIDFAKEVGLVGPNQRVGRPRVKREIDRYGEREIRAIESLKGFRLPADYHYQDNTAAAKFILALAERPALRRQYEQDPQAAIEQFPLLSKWERELLASRRPVRLQLAARGGGVQVSPGEQFVIDLCNSASLRKSWMQLLTTAVKSKPKNWAPVDAWLSANYQGLTLADVPPAMASAQSWLLMMWNGIYAESGVQPNVLLVMANSVNFDNASVYLNASPLYKITFSNSQLSFNQADGNPCNGQLTFTPGSQANPATITGMLWTTAQGKPATNNFNATLQPLPSNPLSVWTGEYTTTLSNGNAGPNVAVFLPDSANPAPYVVVGSTPVTGGSFSGSTFTWSDGSITFAVNPSPSVAIGFTGTISGSSVTGSNVSSASGSFQGQYATQQLVVVRGSSLWQPYYPLAFAQSGTSATMSFGPQTFPVNFSSREVTWENGPANMQNGDLFFAVNPITGVAYFVGVVWANDTSKPTAPNFQGMASINALVNFTGSYATTVNGAPGLNLVISGGPTQASVQVSYGGTPVKYAFSAGQMTGPAGNAQLSAVFNYTVNKSANPPSVMRGFTGTINSGTPAKWASSSVSNDMLLWVGTYDTNTVNPNNGSLVPGGPTLTISATDATSYSVTLTVNGQVTTIASPNYQANGNALSWANQNVTGAPQYNNGAISFYLDGRGNTKSFKGIFYANGDSAPTTITWTGSLHQGGSGGGGQGWILGVVLGILGGIGIAAAIAIWKLRAAAENDYVEDASEDGAEMQKLKCE